MKNKIVLAFLALLSGLYVMCVYSVKEDEFKDNSSDITELADKYIHNKNNNITAQHLLIQAILKKNTNDIAKAIKNGADVNYVEDEENPLFSHSFGTPLDIAIEYSNPEIVTYLLKNSANPNLTYDYGKSPLMSAAKLESDDATITNILLQYGAKPNMVDSDGYTALYYAWFSNNKTIMQALVQGGADINKQFSEGRTLLSMEIYKYNSDVLLVKTMLELGADPNISDDEGYTPLELEVTTGDVTIVNLLLKYGASVSRRAWMSAIDTLNNLTIIEALLLSGANKSVLPTSYIQKLNRIIKSPVKEVERD